MPLGVDKPMRRPGFQGKQKLSSKRWNKRNKPSTCESPRCLVCDVISSTCQIPPHFCRDLGVLPTFFLGIGKTVNRCSVHSALKMKYVLNLDLVSSHHIIVPNTNLDTNMVTAIGWRLYYDDSATKMLTNYYFKHLLSINIFGSLTVLVIQHNPYS